MRRQSRKNAVAATTTKPRRYAGLELSGAKNQKTALAAIEYYPKENKIFLLDIFERIQAHNDQTGDEALLEAIIEAAPEAAAMGVNVPLTFPPCTACAKSSCPMPAHCGVPGVRWMRDSSRRFLRHLSKKHAKAKEFTPYTQRPVELFIKHNLLPDLHEAFWFEVDEALGGTKAPLTARMGFLKRHLPGMKLLEVWPKLSAALLALEAGIPRRTIEAHRDIELGARAREEIIGSLGAHFGVFIYDRDKTKLARSLTSFDAFICAYTAMLSDTGRCLRAPSGFPEESGWIEIPHIGEE